MTSVLDSDGVTLGAGEDKRIQDALEALAKDPHAPRELTVRITLHIHNEYPKHLHKAGKFIIANNEAEEAAAKADGYGKYVAPTPEAVSK